MTERSRMTEQSVIPGERIEGAILVLRGHRVLLDADLAGLYGVEVKVLNQAVKRNSERFPPDFMFQLSAEEAAVLRSQTVTLEPGRGRHRKYLPYAFTEQGVAMLSSVLRSPRAVRVVRRQSNRDHEACFVRDTFQPVGCPMRLVDSSASVA